VYDKTVRRRRAVLVLLVALSLVLLTAYFGESAGGALHGVQRGVLSVLAPVQEGASRALKPFRDLGGWFGDTLHAKKERNRLRQENQTLRREVIGRDAALAENVQLRKLVNLDQNVGADAFQPIAARVIARSPTLWYATLNVDKGSNAGVHLDDPVMNGDGLVGRISDVTGNAAVVTLITDHTSGVSAKIDISGVTGVVKPAVGNPNDLILDFVPRGARVFRGSRVVTAGTTSSRVESLFPAEVPVGEVTRVDIDPGTLFERVHLRPYANLRTLNFVQVLTGRLNGRTQAKVP
jgi:rod shape-determining protein MreC